MDGEDYGDDRPQGPAEEDVKVGATHCLHVFVLLLLPKPSKALLYQQAVV